MPTNQSTTKKRSSSRQSRGKKGVDAVKLAAFERQHRTLCISLHVKCTVSKGKVYADIHPQACPLLHPSLNQISQRTEWDDIEQRITDVVLSSAIFKATYGNDSRFDIDRGIVGWKGKRKEDENPKLALGKKGIVQIMDNDDWQTHWKEYGTKNDDIAKAKKEIIIDLGLAVYSKVADPKPQKPVKRKADSTPSLDSSSASQKKQKRKWRIQIDLLH